MKLYDVYNDSGFVLRSTLPFIGNAFDLHRAALDRVLGNGSKPTELFINRGKFNGAVITVFPATIDLPAESPAIFVKRSA